MRRDQPTTPFDVEADELTQQFWGAGKGWVSSEQPAVRRRSERAGRRDDTTGSLRVIRDGLAAFRPQTSPNATGEIRRVRQHGDPREWYSEPEPRREATLGELAAGRSEVGGWFDDDLLPVTPRRSTSRAHVDGDHSDRDHSHRDHVEPDQDVPLTPVQPLAERLGLGAVDPLLLRAGAIALALVLLVPVVLSLRPDRDDTLPGDVVEAPQGVVPGAAPEATPDIAPTAAVAPTATPAPVAAQAAAMTTSESTAEPDGPTASTSERGTVESAAPTADASAEGATVDDAAAVDVAAERIVPACPQTYTAAPGDSWYRIADEAGISPGELLAENNATADTVILPGDDVCLPEGASVPSPPTATASDTTSPSDESEPTTTSAPTTTPTTAAPTTTVTPVASLSRSEVQELIRQTWPEDEVDKALAVARRESNFVATADNGWCCVGVFQLYWTVHRGWLDDFGITERSDLFDARKNVAAAFHMWQNQGWGPWGG